MANPVGTRRGVIVVALLAIACSAPADRTNAAAGQTEEGGRDASAEGASALQSKSRGGPPEKTADTSPAASSAPLGTADATARDRALFEAAGFRFVQQRRQWESGECGDPPLGIYEAGAIAQVEDVNGDGRPEAIVTESGSCYGAVGQRFWLLSQQADGRWRVMMESIAIPELLSTRGVDNYPDVQAGGPGFCFPVARWNGREYRTHRHEYEGRPCSPGG